jgi:electron transfer flavoprotein beta subunit
MAEQKFDLILTGLQSDDQGHAQFGPILAEKLGIPHSTIIMEVNMDPSTSSGPGGGTLKVKRELEGGWFQYVTMPLPALLTIQSGINTLRYATLKGIMAAKKKEIAKVAAPAGLASRQKIVSLYAPQKAKQTVMITGSAAEAAKELVRRLREEARVL